MKKYKLIRTIPFDRDSSGGLAIGSILETNEWINRCHLNPIAFPDWFEEVKEPEFKVGDWVKVIDSNSAFNDFNEAIGYIFRMDAEDGNIKEFNLGCAICIDPDNKYFINYTKDNVRLATTEEIKKHLLAEAEKRGFKEGVKFKGITHPKGKNGFQVTCRTVFFNENHSYNLGCYLYSNNEYIYLDGQWAEIIKEEELIVIAGYGAEFNIKGQVSFGCKTYSKETVDRLINVIENFHITQFNTDKAVIDSKLVYKIRDRIK